MNDRLGVAPGAVVMAACLEPGPERRVVVNLAVVDDPARFVLVGHGLLPAGDVDDGEPPVAEADRPLRPEALAVRPSMTEHVTHALEQRLVHGFARAQVDDADDSTHGWAFRSLPNGPGTPHAGSAERAIGRTPAPSPAAG